MSDVEFNNYLELSMNDKDQSMAGSATINLFRFIELTDNQFDKLTKAISTFGSWTEKIIIRETFKRKLKTYILSDALFTECMETADSVIQEILLTKASASQLLQLLENGQTKKIRNISNDKLKKMKLH